MAQSAVSISIKVEVFGVAQVLYKVTHRVRKMRRNTVVFKLKRGSSGRKR